MGKLYVKDSMKVSSDTVEFKITFYSDQNLIKSDIYLQKQSKTHFGTYLLLTIGT